MLSRTSLISFLWAVSKSLTRSILQWSAIITTEASSNALLSSVSQFLQRRNSMQNFVSLLCFAMFPPSETNFFQHGSVFWWGRYAVHEADRVTIINRRLKQLYGTQKYPLLPALTYGPGLQAALDHLNYCNNQPSPAGAHYHDAHCCYWEHWQPCHENQLRKKKKRERETLELYPYTTVKQKALSVLRRNQKKQHSMPVNIHTFCCEEYNI